MTEYSRKSHMPDVSIVIPVMNEEESILPLADEVTRALNGADRDWECLWIDDASTDSTADVLRSLAEDVPRHRFFQATTNRGQSAALAAGFRLARGQLLGTLDGDGQNNPADLPALLDRLDSEELDMVNGIRAKRQDTWIRKSSSHVGNGFRNWLTGASVTDVGCAIRVFRKECVLRIPVFRGMHRFLPTLVQMQGFRIAEQPVDHRQRECGVTKYGIGNRLWVGIGDTLAVRWMQRRMVWDLSTTDTRTEPGG
jgi:dolichol-phosphate mannosyltransferase